MGRLGIWFIVCEYAQLVSTCDDPLIEAGKASASKVEHVAPGLWALSAH